jgi:protein SCO1
LLIPYFYRVYFSTPPNTTPNDDYLVDHSIFIYLMDPEGQFVEAFGQAKTTEEVIAKIEEEVREWIPSAKRRDG